MMEFNWWQLLIAMSVTGIGIWAFSFFTEWLIVKRVIDNPAKGGIVSIFLSFAIALVWNVIDMANGKQAVVTWQTLLILFGGLGGALLLQWPGYKRAKRKYEMHTEVDEFT